MLDFHRLAALLYISR